MPAPILRILHQDESLVAVDKPSGMAVHRGWSQERYTVLQVLRDQVGRPGGARAAPGASALSAGGPRDLFMTYTAIRPGLDELDSGPERRAWALWSWRYSFWASRLGILK